MRPHPQHTHRVFRLAHFIDQAVLDVDAARIGPGQIAHQLFIGRWVLEWVVGQHVQKRLRVRPEPGSRELLGVLQRMPGENNCPRHQATAVALSLRGSAMPCWIDSRMPGTDSRNSVS